MARIAWHYHFGDRTQEEIARLLHISRTRVARGLARAREEGIVQVQVFHPVLNCLRIEQELKARFDLHDAMVVPSQTSGDVRDIIGKAGAEYLARILRDGDLLGTAWGTTVHAVARHLSRRQLPNLSIVLLLGGLSSVTPDMDAFDLARTMAGKCGGRCFYLHVPAIVDSSEIREAIISDASVRNALDLARSVSKAILGIGDTTNEAAMLRAGFLDVVKMAELRARGAVGDILGRFFDAQGVPVQSDLNDRTIGLGLDDVKRIPTKIAVSGGHRKVRPILGAIRGGYVDILITDEETAQAILRLQAQTAAGE